jgi:hypothetical protein
MTLDESGSFDVFCSSSDQQPHRYLVSDGLVLVELQVKMARGAFLAAVSNFAN